MSQNTIDRFHENVSQRLSMMGVTLRNISDICGISRQAWHSARVSANPTIKTVRRMALILAIDANVLFEGTDEDVVRFPVPKWDYKAVLEANKDNLGMTSTSKIIPPRWETFVESHGPE